MTPLLICFHAAGKYPQADSPNLLNVDGNGHATCPLSLRFLFFAFEK